MTWNWQKDNWPEFTYNAEKMKQYEARFLHSSGVLTGALTHMDDKQRQHITIDLMCTEAVKSSEIEGEILNRDSVQSSIRRNFGLKTDYSAIPPAEAGISEMMVDLYHTFKEPLTHKMVCGWHDQLMQERRDLDTIGDYRAHKEPMQIVSGRYKDYRVHFEAPPSDCVYDHMDSFITWFNQTGPSGKDPLPALTRAAIAHLYFVCIHPFEDGNGRIGRAIAEKALSQCLGSPTLIALSLTIQNNKRYYYEALEDNNQNLEITNWVTYFSETILGAQSWSQSLVDFLIHKTKLYDRLNGQLNDRQKVMLSYLFEKGPDVINEDVSAEKYISVTETSRATATRDLQDLVEKQVFLRLGERKHTRYYLNIPVKNKLS